MLIVWHSRCLEKFHFAQGLMSTCGNGAMCNGEVIHEQLVVSSGVGLLKRPEQTADNHTLCRG